MCICTSNGELRANGFSLRLLLSFHVQVTLSVSQLLSKTHLRHLFALDLYSVDVLPLHRDAPRVFA